MAERLPIYEIESEILGALRHRRRLILSAPTGSGKSTQVPQMLLKHGLLDSGEPEIGNPKSAIRNGMRGRVVVLQPRRIAARLLAARVAEELEAQLGQAVGYQIRFENVTSPNTRICFVTEGVLLRQMVEDPTLTGISAILFDEFHERHLYGDITLARALDIQETVRPDLQLAVMSATLDSALLERYLSDQRAPRRPELDSVTLSSAGRMHPVGIHYSDTPSYAEREPVWEQAADAFARYVSDGGEGDVLVFMPGAFEIARTLDAIGQRSESKGFLRLPLHGELNPRDQDAAVARYHQRKVVVATNVAETSLTIDGVRLVIDSGLARIPRFDPYRGINTLLIEKISQASADQRTGRAGRTAPGECYRLWSEEEHRDRAVQEKPEVQRLDLAEVVLTLKAAGVDNLHDFRWLEHPGDQRLEHAEELLVDLGALAKAEVGGRRTETDPSDQSAFCNLHSAITPLGRRMLAFPLHPRYSRMLLAAQELGCVYQACLVAALTQGRDLLLRKVDKSSKDYREDLLGDKAPSDFFLLMRAWNFAAKNNFALEACKRMGVHAVTARQVGPLLEQFLRIARREGLDAEPRPANDEALQKCILIGFSDRVARRLDSGTLRCELVHNRRGVLARESAVQHATIFVPAEVREVGQHGGDTQTILSLATEIRQEWLTELFPEDLARELEVFYDATARRVYAQELQTFRGLELDARTIEPPPLEPAAKLLAEQVVAGKLALKEWDHSVEQWITRLNLLAKWCPEFELPPLTPADHQTLIEQLCHGAFTYKEIKDRPVKPVLRDWLNPMQRQLLEEHAPERLRLSNGRTPKVAYSETEPPHIALRIQELYDVTETPKIAMGRVPVLLHILAPNNRPVQITRDLAGFWREHYPKVKSELQRKYPKHPWR
jgi:ATP-dependent helicase HrpB